MSVRGGCLCGKVRYQIKGRLFDASHCHCSMCRRQHGAAFATYVDFDPESHIFVGSKANWDSITDKLPQYDEWPPET